MNIHLLPDVALAAPTLPGRVSAATMSQELLPDRLPGFAAFGESDGLPGPTPLVALIVFASLIAIVTRLVVKRPCGLTASIPLPESGLRRVQRGIARRLYEAPPESDGTRGCGPSERSVQGLSAAGVSIRGS